MVETYLVTSADDGLSLIDVLMRRFALSVRQLRRAKNSKLVRVNGNKISMRATMREGDVVTLTLVEEENIFPPEPIAFEVIYEDDFLLAANKPPFLVVHPTKTHPVHTLGNAVAFHMEEKGDRYKIRFINRLDRDTSGVVLIAKNALAQQRITDQMRDGSVTKKYFAVVEGATDAEGVIDLPIGRRSEDDVVRIVTPNGKRAITKYRLLRRIGDDSLVEIELITGRTHQIRVHFQAIGHPLIGDPLYGTGSPYIGRQALHCAEMTVLHPFTSEPMSFCAPLPEDMNDAVFMLEQFGGTSFFADFSGDSSRDS